MHRSCLLVPSFLLLAACPGDRDDLAQDTLPLPPVSQDTGDLSGIVADIPPVAVDSPTTRQTSAGEAAPEIPRAPEPLLDVVRRESASNQFCYTEHGLKRDPSLRGALTMVVTVGAGGITAARVGASNWEGSREAGRAVNDCLVEQARRAWTVPAGAVSPGRYQIPLRFSGA